MSNRILVAFSGITLLGGCASSPASPPQTASASPVAVPARPVSKMLPNKASKSVVTVSEDIRRACGIRDVDAHFDFDSAQLHRGDYPVLGKVAQCFANGPLSKDHLRLVGHTDPRGDSEYNLVLGSRRADSVGHYLSEEGLSSGRMATVSRGEYEAKGTDEASWAGDRRVDLILAN